MRLWHRLQHIVVLGASLVLTFFILANSYELIFNRSLPFANSLVPTNLDSVLRDVKTDKRALAASTTKAEHEGTYGAPTYLKIPSMQIKIPAVPAIYSANNEWLARSGSAHYLIVTPSKNGSLGNTVLYTKQSWRTLPAPDLIKIGDTLFIETNHDWRYLYKVKAITTLSSQETYVIEDGTSPKLVVMVQDKEHDRSTLISADFVNLQNNQ